MRAMVRSSVVVPLHEEVAIAAARAGYIVEREVFRTFVLYRTTADQFDIKGPDAGLLFGASELFDRNPYSRKHIGYSEYRPRGVDEAKTNHMPFWILRHVKLELELYVIPGH